MASNPELLNLNEEEKKKLMQAREEKKWSYKIFGTYVPIWIILVVIVVVLYYLHKNGYLNTIESKAVEFSDGTRRMLDKVKNKITTSTTSPFNPASSKVPSKEMGASSKGSSNDQVKMQLRNLFNSF